MDCQDEQIRLKVEEALACFRSTQSRHVEPVVSDGKVLLIARLEHVSELIAVLRALELVPGVRDISLDASIAEPMSGQNGAKTQKV